MSYDRLNLPDGIILTAEHIKHIEDGIIDVAGNKWAGKIASFLGDSITRGKNSDKAYPEYLKELVGFSVCNSYGISGSTIANFYEAMWNRVSSIDAQSDIVFVFGGVNDFNQSIPMGEWYTLNGTTRTVNRNTSTFRGALTTLCENLINKFPHKKKVLITPLHCHTYADNYTDLQANSQGLYLEDYVNAIKEAGKMYSIPVIDLYGESGLFPRNNANAAIYFHSSDKLHPNATGHRVIADVIMGFLDRTYLMYGEYVQPDEPEQPAVEGNLVPSAEERIISGDALTNYDGVGYANNYRLSSSGVVKAQDNAIVTGFMPASANGTVCIGGIQWTLTGGAYNYVCAYKSDYSFIGAVYGSEAGFYGTKIHASYSIDYDTPLATIKLANIPDIAFIRVSCYNGTIQSGADLIITVSEETTDEPEQPNVDNNLVPTAEEKILDGDKTNVSTFTYDGVGYATGVRLSSSGYVKTLSTGIVTGFIDASANGTVCIGGIQWCKVGGANNYVCAYKSDYSLIGAVYGSEAGFYGTKIHASCTIDYNTPLVTIKLTDNKDIAFIRIGCDNGTAQNGADLIVTVNQEITE